MTNRLFCWVSIFLLGAAPTETGITQTPRYLVTRVKQEVKLRCQQNLGHNYMYWYQQKPQKGPKLMFYYTYKDLNLNETVPPRFEPASSGNGHLTLKIHPVEAEDSATYFCSSSK
uniref:Ig-like domain-containing protein n=1 Tax=Sarcophilus harrisii TaxID=9305 RepID=A0A7N4PCS2_SARHA